MMSRDNVYKCCVHQVMQQISYDDDIIIKLTFYFAKINVSSSQEE